MLLYLITTIKIKNMKQILFLLMILIGFSCKTNEDDFISASSGFETNADFIKLTDMATSTAGELSIRTNQPEVTVKWNTKAICNLDTTITKLTVKNGMVNLPIKWAETLAKGVYGLENHAYRAGVQLIAGEYSKYIPLIWADGVDSTEIISSIPVTRAGDIMPRVSEIAMIPTEIRMTEENGDSMRIELNDIPYAILDISAIREDMNIDVSSFDPILMESTTLYFEWGGNGAPSFAFSAPIIVMADEIMQIGTINFIPKVTISVESSMLTLKHSKGSTASTKVITNDTQGWTASADVNWLSVTQEGINGDSIMVTSLTPSKFKRVGKVIIHSKTEPTVTDTITVTQKGIFHVNVMTVGNTAIGGEKVGSTTPTLSYVEGLYPLLTNESNFGLDGNAGFELSFYNYYNGLDNDSDYVVTDDMLSEYDINILCLYGKKGYGPNTKQVEEILSWLSKSPDRGLIFSFDNDSTMNNLLTELKLFDRKVGGGTDRIHITSASSPIINDIVYAGPFGAINNCSFSAIDNEYGNISRQSGAFAGFYPILMDAQNRIIIGVNPQKRIIFHGDTRFGSFDVLNTDGSMDPTNKGAYPQLMGNLWTYLCNLILHE